jgi:GTP-binding protein HflX
LFEVAKLRVKEKAILVGVKLPSASRFAVEESLQELALLTETAGGEVLETVIQERQKLNSTFFIGKGKTQEIKNLSSRLGANIIIFDDDLTPAQVYNPSSPKGPNPRQPRSRWNWPSLSTFSPG